MRRQDGEVGRRSMFASTLAIMIVIGVSGCSSTPRDTAEGEISAVIDGGTVEVSIDVRSQPVRLINIETPSATDDPDSTGCLQRESTEMTERLLPVGSTVRLEFDTQRVDASGQIVAAVFVKDASVNEAIASAGLGVPDLGDGDTRFLSGISKAHEQARTERVGLFSADDECTVPGQVLAAAGIDCVEVAGAVSTGAVSTGASPGSSTPPSTTSAVTLSVPETVVNTGAAAAAIAVGASSVELKKRAELAAATLATAVDLQSWAARNGSALIWRALNRGQRESCTSTINDLVQRATRDHAAVLSAIAIAEKQEAEAARKAEEQRIAADEARVAEEQRVAAKAEAAAEAEAARNAEKKRIAAEEARVAEEQRVAAKAEAARNAEEKRIAAEEARVAEEQRVAAEAEASRVAEEQRHPESDGGRSPSGGSTNSNDSGNSSGGGNPSGYTGPRCYAPGGQTWKPC